MQTDKTDAGRTHSFALKTAKLLTAKMYGDIFRRRLKTELFERSYTTDTAPVKRLYFMSLNISLSHSRSLKVIQNDTLEYGVCKSLLAFH